MNLPTTLALTGMLLLAACGADPGATPTGTEAPTEVTETPSSESPTAPPSPTPEDPPPSPLGQVTPEPEPSRAQEPEPGPATPSRASVSMVDFDFAPTSIEVAAGGTVTWSNDGDIAHTATIDGGGPDTGTVSSGDTASLTFPEAGTFTYTCQFHPADMQGTVVVR